MTKTAKNCAIFFITTLWLVVWRIVFSFLNLSDNVTNWLFSIVVQIFGMGVIPLTLYKLWVKEDVISGFYLKVKLPPAVYVLAVVLGLLLAYLTTGVSLIWQNMLIFLGFTHVNSAGTIYSDAGVLVMEIVTTAMLPAIFEELTDRGLAIRMLRGIEDDKTVMILVAVLFGLAHQNIMQTGYAFVGGLVFAYLALKTRSIIPGMIIHFINNFLNVIGGYSSQHNGFYAAIEDKINAFIGEHFFLAILTWIAVAFIIVGILRYIAGLTKQEEREKPPEDSVYYYPNKMQYVDDLFGSGAKRDLTKDSAPAWYEYAFLYGSAVMMIATTLFTFMWGVWR